MVNELTARKVNSLDSPLARKPEGEYQQVEEDKEKEGGLPIKILIGKGLSASNKNSKRANSRQMRNCE